MPGERLVSQPAENLLSYESRDLGIYGFVLEDYSPSKDRKFPASGHRNVHCLHHPLEIQAVDNHEVITGVGLQNGQDNHANSDGTSFDDPSMAICGTLKYGDYTVHRSDEGTITILVAVNN